MTLLSSSIHSLLLLSLGSSALAGQAGQVRTAVLDSIAGAAVRENRSVGIVAAAFQGKNPLLLQAYGKADIEGAMPMTVGTMVPIGSVTKMFTAVAVLQLRDQGKLSLDDDITRWLPDLNTGGNRVTLRHILGHTAGLVELGAMPELRAIQLMRNATVTRDSVYHVISRYPPRFTAGTMQLYSNTGYWLLGLIIEKASGMSYAEYIEQRIFQPLGMSRSMYCNSTKSVPNRAAGYGLRNGITRRAPDIVHTGTYSGGAICSTAEDMVMWLRALHGGKVLSAKSYAELITPAKLSDGTTLRYGMGQTIAEDSHGLRYIGHNGGGFGYSSEARWYPEAELAIVVLTNSEPDEITMTAEALAAAVLPAPRAAGPYSGDATLLVGKYKGPGHGGDMVIDVTQGPQGIAVSVNGAPATPSLWIEAWTFRRKDVLLTFRRTGDTGPATELRFDTGGDHVILKREPAAP